MFFCGVLIALQGCSPKANDAVVASIGEKSITLSDYEKMYVKSNSSGEPAANSTQEEREKFLALMINFRLKLADAYRQGLEKSPEIIGELDQYKGSLAASFLTEHNVTRPGLQKLYERRKTEIRASHILLTVPTGAKPEDTLAVYAKAADLIARVTSGADFEALALEHSQDPSVKQNKGDLYYFTGGQMAPAFEEAAYALKPGEISSVPVRTQYGLHIIRVVDKKPAPGEVQCSHIMIRFEKQDPTPEDTLAAYERTRAIQDSLASGADFAELARRNSGDPGSAARGGDLGWFTRRRWIQPFDEVAMSLSPGQVSGIVRTIYGYHLIKCYGSKLPKTFEEAREDLQRVYQQTRFQEDFSRYVAHLKRETAFALDDSVLSLFVVACDSNKSTRDSAWDAGIMPELGQSPIMTCKGTPVTVDSLVSLIKNRPDFSNVPLRAASIRTTVDKIAEQLVFAAKAEDTRRDYPEFAALMNEYLEGILLYQVEQERVWNRIVVSDSALREYFERNRERFAFPDRVDFAAVTAANDSVARLIYSQVNSGKSLEEIAAADSARMKAPSTFQAIFASGVSKISPQSARVLEAVAKELNTDGSLRVQLTAYPDTTTRKSQNEKVATKRLDAVKSFLLQKTRVSGDRISTTSRPVGSVSSGKSDDTKAMSSRVDITIVGRRPLIFGGVEHQVLAVATDERSMAADSLRVGSHSTPFRHGAGYSIVRLNKKEPARLKTFEEAGTEISSSFQEYESKRLEKEWLDGLRRDFPVVEHNKVLKDAFAHTQ
jgi:peptidyl-prolyl cis-trans isomerase SurA